MEFVEQDNTFLLDFSMDVQNSQVLFSDPDNSMFIQENYNEERSEEMELFYNQDEKESQEKEQPLYIQDAEESQEVVQPLYTQDGEESQETEQPLYTQDSEKSQEIEQPLHKLKNIDTESSVKTEIKQIIMTKISEEIDNHVLSHMTYEAEEQISTLKNKTGILENKIQELDNEVEIDENRLAQIEVILIKTDEMISLLKENIEKLMIRYRESYLNKLSNISRQQLEKLNLLKMSYLSQIANEKQNLKNKEAAGIERNTTLKSNLTQKDELLKMLKKKLDEFKKIIKPHDDEIEKYRAKKQTFENRLSFLSNKREMLENEFIKQKDSFKSLSLNKSVSIDKFNEMKERQTLLESQLKALSQELEESKTNLTEKENQILEKEFNIGELRNKLKVVKQNCQESFKNLQEDSNNNCHQLNTISTDIGACSARNDDLLTEVNALKVQYVQKCEGKLAAIKENSEKQDVVQKMKMDLLKKQVEIEAERSKYEELQGQYQKFVKLLESSKADIIKNQSDSHDQLMQLKLKFEAVREEHDKSFSEMKKKKEYLLANSTFLEEKSENVKNERTKLTKIVEHHEEENISFKTLVGKIQKQLEEKRGQLNALKSMQDEVPLKSGLKSPSTENLYKKVKFNEILSFKSPTSSELSALAVDNITELETSIHEWLGESKGESKQLEEIDEEF